MLIYWACCFGVFCVLWTVWLVQDTEWKRIAPVWADLCCHQKPHGAAVYCWSCAFPHHWDGGGPIPGMHRSSFAHTVQAACWYCGTHFWKGNVLGNRHLLPYPWWELAEQSRGLQRVTVSFLFSILAFNQSLLLITKVFPVGRNPTSNDTNFCLYMHMYKYINKSINSVS